MVSKHSVNSNSYYYNAVIQQTLIEASYVSGTAQTPY